MFAIWAFVVAGKTRRWMPGSIVRTECRDESGSGLFFREAGATAVEFAFVLPLLVGMFYAIFTYGYVFVLKQALNFASEEGARAAVAVVDGGTGALGIQQAAANSAVDQALSFLPGFSTNVNARSGQFASVTRVIGPPTLAGPYKVQVVLTMPISTLFPVITLPLIGAVPKLPANLQAISVD